MKKYANYIVFLLLVLGVVGLAVSHSRRIHGLVDSMNSGDKQTQASAATELIKAEQFMDAITGEPVETRLKATEALEALGTPTAVKQALPLLKDQDKTVRERAIKALVAIALKTPDHVKELLPGLKDGDGNVKKGSIIVFSTVGPQSNAIPLLVEYLKKEGDSRASVGTVLGTPLFAKESKTSIPLLKPYLEEKDEAVRVATVEAMGKIGDKEVIPALNEKMHKDTAQVRRVCIGAIALIADVSGEPMLTEAINNTDDDDEARSQSAVGLGKIATPTAIDTLVKALDDADLKLRSAAAASIARAGRPKSDALPVGMVLSKCVSALSSGNENVKIGIAQALQGIAAPEANSSLLSLANNKSLSENLRTAAISALGFPNNTAVVTPLVSLLGESETEVIGSTTQKTLSAIGVAAAPALVASFQKGDEATSYRSALALASMGSAVLPALQQVAQSQNTNAQRWAAVALGEMGIAEAHPILKQLTSSPDPDVAHVAKEQLYRNGELQ